MLCGAETPGYELGTASESRALPEDLQPVVQVLAVSVLWYEGDRMEGGTLTEIHQQIADLLRSSPPVRGGGNAEDVHGPGADLHHEQAVQALESHRAVHVEEVGGEHRRGLGVQKLPARRVGVPLRRWRDLQRPEDPADRGRADPVAELEQLALDPPVMPSSA
jgi:hypothetical protein